MRKIMHALLCISLLSTTQVQSAPPASKLMHAVGKRALAHMQSRDHITGCMLALQGVTGYMLLKALCGAELPITMNHNFALDDGGENFDNSSIESKITGSFLCFAAGLLYPRSLSAVMPKNARAKEKAKWLASLQSANSKGDFAVAINAFLLSAITMRSVAHFVRVVQDILRTKHGFEYDYDVRFERIRVGEPDADGFYDAKAEVPRCRICHGSDSIEDEVFFCQSEIPFIPCIAHKKCIIRKHAMSVKRSFLERWEHYWPDDEAGKLFVGAAVAACFAGFGGWKALKAYRAYRL